MVVVGPLRNASSRNPRLRLRLPLSRSSATNALPRSRPRPRVSHVFVAKQNTPARQDAASPPMPLCSRLLVGGPTEVISRKACYPAVHDQPRAVCELQCPSFAAELVRGQVMGYLASVRVSVVWVRAANAPPWCNVKAILDSRLPSHDCWSVAWCGGEPDLKVPARAAWRLFEVG